MSVFNSISADKPRTEFSLVGGPFDKQTVKLRDTGFTTLVLPKNGYRARVLCEFVYRRVEEMEKPTLVYSHRTAERSGQI